jgi:hypothetical protein
MKQPRRSPAYWNAQGRETTAEPIIVFQTEKMMTKEPYFCPGYSNRKKIKS